MKQRRFKQRYFLLLALLTTFALACGGDDPGSGADTNNTPDTGPNSTPDAGPNNTPDADPNNTPDTDPGNIAGSVNFTLPAEATVYAKGDLIIEYVLHGSATDVELVLDDETILVAFGDARQYTWDTTTVDEGTYKLRLRYTLGGDVLWSSEERNVVVDRTAPGITTTIPLIEEENAPFDTPIELHFDEVLDPATVTTSTVILQLSNDETPAHTVSLSADGMTITVDFDRGAISLPYASKVELDGVADLAGNTINEPFAVYYNVPFWLFDTIPQNIVHPVYLAHEGQEYLVGMVPNRPDDLFKVFKRNQSELGTWDEIASQGRAGVYDFALTTFEGKFYIAALHKQLDFKRIQLYAFDPTTEAFTETGHALVGNDSNNGKIALDVHRFSLAQLPRVAVAVVTDGKVRVYEANLGALGAQTTNSFPSDTAGYGNARYESLSIKINAEGRPEVLFPRCMGNNEPCLRTAALRVARTGQEWAKIGNDIVTPPSTGECDPFINFDATYTGYNPSVLFAYQSPCDAPLARVRIVEGDATGWTHAPSAGVLHGLPTPDESGYRAHLAFDDAGLMHGLFASKEHVFLAQLGESDVTWFPEVTEFIFTSATVANGIVRSARGFITPDDAPLVVFTNSARVYIMYENK